MGPLVRGDEPVETATATIETERADRQRVPCAQPGGGGGGGPSNQQRAMHTCSHQETGGDPRPEARAPCAHPEREGGGGGLIVQQGMGGTLR